MLTSTAGEESTAAAKAAPVASARTLDAVAAASARAMQGGTLSFPAATRWAPKRRMVPNMSHLLLTQSLSGQALFAPSPLASLQKPRRSLSRGLNRHRYALAQGAGS